MGRFFSSLFASLNSNARAIIAFLLPVLRNHSGQLLAVALPIAQSIVAGLANQQLPNADKRDQAASQLKGALISQGYATAADIGASLLNLAIEMAVARLKVA
jgi:hypothetical protein